jgi:hypothetical protein
MKDRSDGVSRLHMTSTRRRSNLKPRVLSTMITEDDSKASLHLAMEVAGYFELDAARAKAISKEVAQSVERWRKEAVPPRTEQNRN